MGVVVEVGAEAKGFNVGDRAGVGCFVDACFNCSYCARDLEQHCKEVGGALCWRRVCIGGRLGSYVCCMSLRRLA